MSTAYCYVKNYSAIKSSTYTIPNKLIKISFFLSLIFLGYFMLQENPDLVGDELKQKSHPPLEVAQRRPCFLEQGGCHFSFKLSFKNQPVKFVKPVATNYSVLGEMTERDFSPTPTLTPVINQVTPTNLPTTVLPSPTPAVKLSKEVYKIAVFGDSMVDTMGENMDYLQRSLKKKYPMTGFLLYNYGTGAQNVADGLNRFNKAFVYQTRDFPPISELKPDILIIASFSYNPFLPHDKEKHRAILEQLVNEAKKTDFKVYLLAEIAPLKRGFGKGINGVNWDDNTSYEHATHIIENLENTYIVAETTNVPLIDAFTPSQINSEKEGSKEYVNPDDGIHPSSVGHQFIADLIAKAIKLD